MSKQHQIRRQNTVLERQKTSKFKDFFRAVRTGNVQLIRKLVEKDQMNVNITDAWDNTPLYLACLCGHPDVVQVLLQKGARYEANSPNGVRCYLGALTQEIRQILKDYDTSVITDTNTEINFSEYLESLYERVPGSDIQLFIGNQLFMAHQCILSVRCTYFSEKLESGHSGSLSLTEHVFNAEAFEPLLQFIYTGSLDLEIEYKKQIIALAEFLGFQDLADVLHNWNTSQIVKHQKLQKRFNTDLQYFVSQSIPYTLGPPSEDNSPNVKTYPDVVFEVKGHSFKCHKVFFYGRSEFFRELLVDREDEQPPSFGDYLPSIRLIEVTPDVFAEVVRYIYTNEIKVTEQNCIALLKAGNHFHLHGMKKSCMGKLQQLVNVNNVVECYQALEGENVPRIQNYCLKLMAEELEQMLTKPEFEEFMRLKLRPLTDGGTFDQILFFQDFQAYIRSDCDTWDSMQDANIKLQKFNQFLHNVFGLHVSLAMFHIGKKCPVESVGNSRNLQGRERQRERAEVREEERQQRAWENSIQHQGKQKTSCSIL